eukprot:3558612-Amphidinium_carterae.1
MFAVRGQQRSSRTAAGRLGRPSRRPSQSPSRQPGATHVGAGCRRSIEAAPASSSQTHTPNTCA